MSASDALSGMQFKYHEGENRAYTKNWTHELHAWARTVSRRLPRRYEG